MKDCYTMTAEFKTSIDENSKIIKKYFKPNKCSSIFHLSKDLMIILRKIEGLKDPWCSRSSIRPAMANIGYNYVNRRFSINLLKNKDYLKILHDNINLSSDIINIILSKITIDLIYCNRCYKIHYFDDKNHRSDFVSDNKKKW